MKNSRSILKLILPILLVMFALITIFDLANPIKYKLNKSSSKSVIKKAEQENLYYYYHAHYYGEG